MRPVLIVDDDAEIRATLDEFLQIEGFATASARNGLEALRLLQGGARPCAVLLDLMMPVMDGFRFHEEVRRDPGLAQIPIVVITAGDAKAARALGVEAVMRKPIDLDKLTALLRTWHDSE